jgi:hypothetical protein
MNIGNKKCCVALITHKESYTKEEEISFLRCLNVFKNRDIYIVIPNNINSSYFNEYTQKYDNFKIITMDPEWFRSYKTYQKLCCSTDFYKNFTEYDYMLVYQTDCWVYEDRLDEFIELGYDWYGAPWPHLGNNVGNGGFCLRKISKMIEITSKESNEKAEPEDTWFCLKHKNEMNVCDLKTACNFSVELITNDFLKMIKNLPMGFHDRLNMQFWDEDGTKFLEYKKAHLQ